MIRQICFLSFLLILLTTNSLSAQKWGYVTMIAPGGATSITLLDTNSRVVKTISGLTGATGYSSHMVPGGDIWRTVTTQNSTFRGGGIHGRIQKIDYNGKLLFDYTISNNTQCAHHDICPMPNGNVLVIVYELKTAAEVAALGGPNQARYSEKLVELKPTGLNTADIVWQWDLWDHLCQNTNPSLPNYVSSFLDNPHMLNINYLNNKSDWVHMNGVDYNEELDQIALSSHFLNEMWVIDHSLSRAETKKNTGGKYDVGGGFLYRWGNPAAYGASGPTILKVVHDAHWVPKGRPRAGYLAGVNNQGVSNNQTALDYYKTSWDGTKYVRTQSAAYQPATYEFRHAANGYTSNMGSCQELPNGNLLVCLATAAKVYEVDSTGKQLWQYQGMMPIPQAFRYSKCYIENPVATVSSSRTMLDPGESANLNCSISSTGSTGIKYSWSPAEGLSDPNIANPVAAPDKTTTYTVTATSSEGCTASGSVTITVNSGMFFTADVRVDDDSICLGEITQLFVDVTGGSGNYIYAWTSNPAGFVSDQPDPYINPEESTWYIVEVSDGSVKVKDSILITVLPLPDKPSISMVDSLLVSSIGQGNQWFFYGNPIPGATDSTYRPTEHGSYQVQVIDSNGCPSFLSDPFEYFPSGTKDAELSVKWIFTPNPAQDFIRLTADAPITNFRITILDALGRIRIQRQAQEIIELDELQAGTYLIALMDPKGHTALKKLIITK